MRLREAKKNKSAGEGFRDEGKMTRWEGSCESVTKERNERGPFYEKIMMREWGEWKG